MPVDWVFFPKSDLPPPIVRSLVDIFDQVHSEIDSKSADHSSDVVLSKVATQLATKGFDVELGKKKDEAIRVPVLFGLNGRFQKEFRVDAWHREHRIVLEVEAGRAVTNFQFLKDLFEACMMPEVDYLALAVRKTYKRSTDFRTVMDFFDTLYVSRRLQLPLKGVAVIGY